MYRLMSGPRSVIVKTLLVSRDPADVIEFFLDLKNWESGEAIRNAKKLEDEWWQVDTPRGVAKIRIHPNKSLGLFDHEFDGGGGWWTVFCRVTPNASGSTVSWTFVRPETMTQKEFEDQLGASFEKEMEGYRTALESAKS